jgi:hypothetical protein
MPEAVSRARRPIRQARSPNGVRGKVARRTAQRTRLYARVDSAFMTGSTRRLRRLRALSPPARSRPTPTPTPKAIKVVLPGFSRP